MLIKKNIMGQEKIKMTPEEEKQHDEIVKETLESAIKEVESE